MLALVAAASIAQALPDIFVVEGDEGPGLGKRVVLIAGDEEYRSEEMLPQLAKILAKRHGFHCTVSFPTNEKGEIDPNERRRQSGLIALAQADLCILMIRFRCWDDADMKRFADYYLSGKPVLALRTSTHAFAYPTGSTSPYRRYGWQSADWPGGFGKQVLGETWVSHWGSHGSQATRGVIVGRSPVLNGVQGLFGTTDVYEVAPPADAQILIRGQVVAGMNADDPPANGRKKTAAGTEQELNDPMMPLVWTREPVNGSGKSNRIMTSTFGSATDFESEGFRRLLVNGVYWLCGLKPAPKAEVGFVGAYKPSPFGFEAFRKGVRPADLARSLPK